MPNLPSSFFATHSSSSASYRRGSEHSTTNFVSQDAISPRRASLGNLSPVGSANEMLRAASAMAAQASSGAEGLQAVSSALLNQAKAQASAAAHSIQDAAPAPAVANTSHPQSTPMARNWSDSAGYSAAMSAHIASALQNRMVKSRSAAQHSTSSAPISAAIDPKTTLPDSEDPDVQMGQIAAQAAAREAQTQWRTQLALRSSTRADSTTGTNASAAAIGATIPSEALSTTGNNTASSSDPTPSDMSVAEYLRYLGLSHIVMPSQGIEQSFGRASSPSSRYWDATSPQMGFSLSGVPSMPLMPNPPLQMLPPPASPSFRRNQSLRRSWVRHSSSASISSTDSIDNSNDFEPNVMSPFPYPFQVVQTPGGTARAGWWVHVSEVSPEKRAKAVKIGDEPTSRLALPKVTKLESVPEGTKSVESGDDDEEAQVLFQPTYRDFTTDEYSTLATAAAYATAALTSIASTPGDKSQSSSWRPLTASEQEAIANQLRAWAGLEGSHAQAQARRALEERQLHLIDQAIHRDLPTARGSDKQKAAADQEFGHLQHPQDAARFFPPDFASHYRTQLQALAEGYYTRLHNENLAQAYYAQPTTKERPVDTDPGDGGTRGLGVTDPAEGLGDDKVSMPGPAQNTLPCIEGFSGLEPPVHTPTLRPGARDPVELLNAASNAAGHDVSSPEVRDQLLQYAHGLYTLGSPQADANTKGTDKLHPTLLPLLHTLHKLHPNHLPTLLLLSCAYYAADNYAGSLWYNSLILRIDPNYVESMSNIGTTLRALGRYQEAESWWWRAIRLRPGYWDAYENLLGVMCATNSPPAAANGEGLQEIQSSKPRFKEALQLCDHVESHVVGQQNAPGTSLPLHLPPNLPLTQTPRLQNLFYAKGNLKFVLPELGSVPAATEYQKAVEVVLSPDASTRYSLRDLVVAACAVGLLSMGAMLPGTAAAAAALEVAVALGINPANPEHAAVIASGAFSRFCPGGILALVKLSGDVVVNTLLRLGNGQLPMLLLLPEAATQLCKVIFAETAGGLPALARSQSTSKQQNLATLQQAQKQAAQTTSTILLTLAKLFQDATGNPIAGPHGALTLGGIPPSISLLLPLYYLSISMHASASTCNNLGILLSSIPVVTTVINASGQPQQLNGQALAMQYYTQGLQLDPKHPHIYTNLGSLLKDLGHLNEAIKMYQKAVECNPNFDVALANLGNAIKDQGRTQDSVVYYRRAVQVNPHFPEALCGLVNALLAICDWGEVYTDKQLPDQSKDNKTVAGSSKGGWMVNVSELVSRQLTDGCMYGAGAIQMAGSLEDWVRAVIQAMGDTRPAAPQIWTQRLQPFYAAGFDRVANQICEGGYLIQLIERMVRRSQRRWYVDAYGAGMLQAPIELPRVTPAQTSGANYARPKLPSCLVTPAVPTVLPFHTFTYPLSPRQIRLICHRNALRISQSTLTQMWVPDVVYPPPSPPAPRLNVGYVSSDFNNHPLAHLMQSVFGFHDLSRFNVFLYATTPSDGSPYRQKIEREAQHFLDVSTWSNQQVVERIVNDNIHILMNLNGYTKGARNEIFAARPCPVQMEFMGFAGSMASRWTDWVVADPIVCPPEMTAVDRWRELKRIQDAGAGVLQQRPTDLGADLDPEGSSDEWVYPDRFIYMPHTYFVNDHKQGFRESVPDQLLSLASTGNSFPMSEEEQLWVAEEFRRYSMRKELFPNLPADYVIFADFNQLYKTDPLLFRLWLRILKRVPKSILWLLRFPAAGEHHLLREARAYAGDEVASRVIFTDVAPKHIHIHRGRIADLFLDTTECNAHTTAADILWSGTPVLTWPRHMHKMCSRVAASIVFATGEGEQMTVDSEQEYEERAVEMAQSVRYVYYDEKGREVEGVVDEGRKRFASDLEADAKSVAAQPHGTSSAQATGAATATRANQDSVLEQKGGTAIENTAGGSASQGGGNPSIPSSAMDGNGISPSTTSTAMKRARFDSVHPPPPAPAPTGVSLAEKAKHTDANATTDPLLAASIPPRDRIPLPSSPDYPGTVTRRAVITDTKADLAGLRKRLFLTREKSALFDTRGWTRDLEKGYLEAWTRWVLGVDCEDTVETESVDLDSEVGKRIQTSGHIWIKDL
ncbi:related to UDP-N-acetylglucosaminyltransferase [Melanopsichium pennsylvanicum]|uniref:protein O-GlcNAc transferase n=2 Tax=Melanopsichium pennsylvanicum TaxID=63383 RepID=A0AAJ5C452_9BASI|nr:related to UDP-N-acetylglucosaminyltransferase [Melanopsichium pennsylvanicum 4]SNX83267.1 related to UDP-N-acetylglucosaminyltransferase [Melanopsichium pennsylvanicum]